jgi:hypothetical protein
MLSHPVNVDENPLDKNIYSAGKTEDSFYVRCRPKSRHAQIKSSSVYSICIRALLYSTNYMGTVYKLNIKN